MTLKVRNAGTLRTITRMTIRQAGVNRLIRTLKVMDGGVLRTVATFAPPLTVNASPSSVSGTVTSSGPTTVGTGPTTATPSGGIAPYTYLWTALGPYGAPNSPTNATTNFSATVDNGSYNGTFRVTVTDSYGQTATDTVSATFNNLSDGIIE